MHIKDQAVLSTWLAVLNSFTPEKNQSQPVLKSDPDSSIAITGIAEPLMNCILLKNPSDPLSLTKELASLRQELNLPFAAWVTAATNLSCETALKEQFETPGPFFGMVLDIKDARLSPTSLSITIEPVTTPQQAQFFSRSIAEVFHMPNFRERMESWLIGQYEAKIPTAFSYIAKVDGQPAGVTSLIVDRTFSAFPTGGFYNTCVLPAFRNRGVGTAMACHRVNVAKSLGLEYLSIVLMSDAMARGYCERLGFVNFSTMTPYIIT